LIIDGLTTMKMNFTNENTGFCTRTQTATAGQEVLLVAVKNNNLDELRLLLLQSNVDVDVRTPLGQTALHLAAKNGQFEAVKLLLISGANPKALDARGCSPLHLAADCPVNNTARRQVVDLLSIMCTDLNAKTNEGETALSLSLKSNNLDIFRQLLEKGSDVRTVNLNNWTLLHIAAEMNICELLDMLEIDCLKPLSDTTSLDTGMTPLHLAAHFGHLDMVKGLVERNLFSMSIKDGLGQSALQVSIKERHLQVAGFLLDRGWDANEQASGGLTCLHLAVKNNDLDAVNLLLGKGANADVQDSSGLIPLQYALSGNAEDVTQLFLAFSQQPEGNYLSTDSAGLSEIGNGVYLESMDVEFDWTLKLKKNYLEHAHLNNLKLNLALHRFFTFPADYDRRSGMKRLDLAHSGFFFAFDYQSIQCFFCSLEITSLQGWKGLTLEQMNLKHSDESVQRCGQCCPLMAGEDVGDVSIVNPTNYNYEAHRLFSLLERRWTNPNVSVYDLAQKGFYFTGQDDNCRCWFCKLEVRGWEEGDTATGEHKRWNPRCSLLQPNAQTDNVLIGQELVGEKSDCSHSNPFVKADLKKCKFCSLYLLKFI